jgi:hypothetical protein
MDVTSSLAYAVIRKFSAFVMPRTRRITVPIARRAGNFWRIDLSRASCDKTGRKPLRNLNYYGGDKGIRRKEVGESRGALPRGLTPSRSPVYAPSKPCAV